MYLLVACVFVLGYAAIAMEHPIKVDKAASALMLATVLWVLLVIGANTFGLSTEITAGHEAHISEPVNLYASLRAHLGEIAEILFFLIGAMVIIELIDAHDGFRLITDRITTTSAVKLLWAVSFIGFFLSAVIDNLTSTIVMVSLLAKLVKHQHNRWLFVGMLVIAANAGGAFSPIGDVTTTMLWIGQQITASQIIVNLFLPSLAALVVPLILLSLKLKGNIEHPDAQNLEKDHVVLPESQRNFVLFLGILMLLSVPVFKTLTHLPPYMGMLFALSTLWVVTELMHGHKSAEDRHPLTVVGVLRKIDTASVLFFLGILLSVSALATAGHLSDLAVWLEASLGNVYAINVAIGLFSAIVDNVPLVAGAMQMYPVAQPGATGWEQYFVVDGGFWQFLAYCAGTGGSVLIIGSAAGVAAMGMEKIPFGWYLKHISWLALAGYFSGALVYLLIHVV